MYRSKEENRTKEENRSKEENRRERVSKVQGKQEDDGRTIVNMNVEGMPWYVEGDEERAQRSGDAEQEQLTKEQLRMYRWAAVKAGLLVAAIFGGVFAAFIAFCDFVWFR